MQTRLDAWAKKGGKKDKLWDSIKNAEKREGVVISANDVIVVKGEGDDCCKREELEIKPRKRKVERELERLNCLLEQVVQLREEIKKGLEVVFWREKLIELASERAEQVDQCGWDQRLCFGDDEWADFGAGVLESYEDVKAETDQGEMQVDGASEELGEWWCPGKKMCDRHAG
jgi:COMPASS component SPP1